MKGYVMQLESNKEKKRGFDELNYGQEPVV